MSILSTPELFAMMSIPDGMEWGHFSLYDDISPVVEDTLSVVSDDWEVVGVKVETLQTSSAPRVARWCKHGNACLWQNCPFRHERCEHYDKWVESRGRTRGCRSQQTDQHNCSSPEDGGCKYDHRDMRTLEVYHKSLPCSSEKELWDSFYTRGLEYHAANCFDVSGLSRTNRALLIRSLEAVKIPYEDYGNWMQIAI